MNKKRDNSRIGLIYWVVPILKHLTNIERFQMFYRKYYGGNPPKNLTSGYAFLIILVISNLIENIIKNSSVLDLEDDFLIEKAFQEGIPHHELPCHTSLGRFVRNLAELYTPLLGIKTWEQLTETLGEIKKLLVIPLEESFNKTVELSPAISERENLSKNSVLNDTVPFFAIYCHWSSYIKRTYNCTYGKNRSSFVQRMQMPMEINEQKFFDGYNVGIKYLWHCFFDDCRKFKSLRRISESKDWTDFDTVFEEIREEIIRPHEKRTRLDYTSGFFVKRKRVPSYIFRELTTNLIRNRRYAPDVEKFLDEVFMWYPVRIVNFGYSVRCTEGFITALLGSLRLENEDKVEVVQFVHPQEDGDSYSFAILIESANNLADYSCWWIFLDFCSNSSGTGGNCYREICEYLERHKKRIDLSRIEVQAKELEEYVKSPYVSELENDKKDLKEYNDRIRGRLFEIFIAYLFSRQGYEVYWSKKMLGKEFDVIAVKKNQRKMDLLVIECSTSYHREKDVEEIKQKIAVIQSNFGEVSKKLGLVIDPESRLNINGIYVTTWKTGEKELDKNISMMGSRELEKLCKKYKISYNRFKQLMPY